MRVETLRRSIPISEQDIVELGRHGWWFMVFDGIAAWFQREEASDGGEQQPG